MPVMFEVTVYSSIGLPCPEEPKPLRRDKTHIWEQLQQALSSVSQLLHGPHGNFHFLAATLKSNALNTP